MKTNTNPYSSYFALLFLAGIFNVVQSAEASTNTWQTASGTWNTPSNWSGNAVPTTNDVAVINSGTAILSSGTNPALEVVLGQAASDNGTLLVTGSSSQLNITGTFDTNGNASTGIIVGDSGTGSFSISNGGAVHLSTAFLSVGNSEGSTGTIFVNGNNSLLTADQQTTIGNDGRGTLTINGGGNASFTGLQIGTGGGYGSGLGSGTVTVGGSSSGTLSNGGSSLGVINGNLNVGAGGVVHSGNDTRVYVGQAGNLVISGGGYVDGLYGTVDGGVATVSGNGSKWVTTSTDSGLGLDVGTGFSGGSLVISNQGLVDVGSRVQIGGNLTVSSSGTLTAGENLYVAGSGSATISTGGVVNVGQTAQISDSGSVVITGTSSVLNAQVLKVGRNNYDGTLPQTASLVISDGAHVNTTSSSYIGADNGNGSVSVTGINSVWAANNLVIGLEGNAGSLSISHGGAVTGGLTLYDSAITVSSEGTLTTVGGHLFGSTITVTNSYSSWTDTGYLDVGGFPTPDTTVINVQRYGAVHIQGPQTRIYDQATLRIEGDATGVFDMGTITNNGVFEFAKLGSNAISSDISGTGSLVKSGSGTLTLSGNSSYSGTTMISAGTLRIDGDATGVFETGDITNNSVFEFAKSGSNSFSSVISGSGSFVKSGTGTLTLSGDNSYSGGSILNQGTLTAGNSNALGTGALTLQGGTFLLESGVHISNSITLAGGSLAQEIAGGTALTTLGGLTGHVSGGVVTTASFLAGQTSANGTIKTGFTASSTATNDANRVSDIFSLSGVPVVNIVTGETDKFVLQLALSGVTMDSYLAWLNPNSNSWVNAVDGNYGGTSFFAGNGSYNPLTDFNLGTYGVDTTTGTVWAVLNHNSDFSTIGAVPEPSTYALFGLGALVLVIAYRWTVA